MTVCDRGRGVKNHQKKHTLWTAPNYSDVTSVTRHSLRVFFYFDKHLKRVHSEVNDYVNY